MIGGIEQTSRRHKTLWLKKNTTPRRKERPDANRYYMAIVTLHNRRFDIEVGRDGLDPILLLPFLCELTLELVNINERLIHNPFTAAKLDQ
jgi:hypothetical protein